MSHDYQLQEGSETRYCWSKLSARSCACLAVSIVVVSVVVIVCIAIFVVGRSLAVQEIKNSEMVLKMAMSNPSETGFDVHITGTLDNRGTVSATLKSAVIDLKYKNQKWGSLDFPDLYVEGAALTNLNINSTIKIANQDIFNDFSTALLLEKSVALQMSASLSAKAYGITYPNLDFDKEVTFLGCNGFIDPPAQVLKQTVTEGLTNEIIIKATTQIFNPSSLSIATLGRLNLTVHYQGQDIGYALADEEVAMGFGLNTFRATVHVVRTPQNADVIMRLLAGYVAGDTMTIQFHGSPYSTTIDILKPSLAKVKTNADLTGLVHKEDKLFQTVYSLLNVQNLTTVQDTVNCDYTPSHLYTDVYLFSHNPLGVDQVINKANFTLTWDGSCPLKVNCSTFGPNFPGGVFAYARNFNMNLVVPAGGSVVYKQRLCMEAENGVLFQVIMWIAQTKADTTGIAPFIYQVSVEGFVEGLTGNYRTVIPYHQENMLVVMHLAPSPPPQEMALAALTSTIERTKKNRRLPTN